MTPNKIQGLLGTGLFMLLCVSPVEAQAPADPQIEDLKKEIQSLKDGQKAIQKQLQEIRSLLRTRRAPAAPKEVVLDITGNPFQGNETAAVTLIEFSDYQ